MVRFENVFLVCVKHRSLEHKLLLIESLVIVESYHFRKKNVLRYL